jgi:hypothetical protein
MKFELLTITSVPAGSYNAKFLSCDPYDENVEKYGKGVSLSFQIIGGEHDGETATRICSMKFSPKSNLYRFAKSLAGRELKPGEFFDFEEHVGCKGMLVVEATDSGSTRVATFLRSDS